MGAKNVSKKDYLKKRRARVRELYFSERLTPREITRRLVDDGTISTSDESLASALRLVRSDVAELRAELVSFRDGDADPSVAFTEVDAIEAELADLRREYDRQLVIAAGEPVEMCARSRARIAECIDPQCAALGKHAPFVGPAIGVSIMDTPQGPLVSYKALWPAGVRQKASKDASLLREKISKLEVVLADKRKAPEKPKKGDVGGVGEDDIFRIVTSNKPTDQLIAENAASEKVN